MLPSVVVGWECITQAWQMCITRASTTCALPCSLLCCPKIQTCSWLTGSYLFTASSFCLHYRNYGYWAVLRSSSDYTGSWDLKLPQDLLGLQSISKAEGQGWKGWKGLKMGGMVTFQLHSWKSWATLWLHLTSCHTCWFSPQTGAQQRAARASHTHFGEM